MPERPLALALAAALGLSACAGFGVRIGEGPAASEPGAEKGAARGAKRSAEAAREAKENAAIESALRLVASKRASYAIGPADLLEISVYQEPDLERKARVSPDGTITMPLIGEAKVDGLTVAEAEEALTRKLKRYLLGPHVSVFIREYGNKQVYVLGEVQKPGTFTLPTESPLTVIEAVAMAGGFTQYAATNRTRVIRQKDGSSETIFIEVSAITKRGDKSKDILLQPNDVVFVPESLF